MDNGNVLTFDMAGKPFNCLAIAETEQGKNELEKQGYKLLVTPSEKDININCYVLFRDESAVPLCSN